MLSIHGLSGTKLHKIRSACSYLFSHQLARKDGFLKSLKLASVKNAFREKAKRYHPDVHGHEPEDMVEKRRQRFIKIRESYEILRSYIFEEDKSVSARSVRRRKIIAVLIIS